MSSAVSLTEGEHRELDNLTTLPYKHIRNLGHGSSAVVDMIEDMNSSQVFARKTLRTYYGRDRTEFKRKFQAEVEIIRRLSNHPHMIRVFATYSCKREFGMILHPVANDGDLGSWLEAIAEEEDSPTPEQVTMLDRAFGCLASGLAFIHGQTIRHKDIKPQNILVHDGLVMYTDFGIALDSSESQNTTTYGTADAFTFRYCAPEIIKSEKRNRKSDVFSLGCVYLEMLDVLEPNLRLDSLGRNPYHMIIPSLQLLLQESQRVSMSRGSLLKVFIEMIQPEPDNRITSQKLFDSIFCLRTPAYMLESKWFCPSCILKDPNYDSPGSSMEKVIQLELGSASLNHIAPMAISHTGQRIAFGSIRGTIRVWNARTGAPLNICDTPDRANSDSPDPLRLAAADKSHDSEWVLAIAFSMDESMIISGFFNGEIKIWDVQTGQLIHVFDTYHGRINVVAFAPDGRQAASGSWDGTVSIWDLEHWELQYTIHPYESLPFTENSVALAFSPDSSLLAIGCKKGARGIHIWKTRSRSLWRIIDSSHAWVLTVIFSPDNKHVACGFYNGNLRIWRCSDGKEYQWYTEGRSECIVSIAFSPDSKLLVSGSICGTVEIWDVDTGRRLQELTKHSSRVRLVAFSSDGKSVILGSGDGIVGITNLPSNSE